MPSGSILRCRGRWRLWGIASAPAPRAIGEAACAAVRFTGKSLLVSHTLAHELRKQQPTAICEATMNNNSSRGDPFLELSTFSEDGELHVIIDTPKGSRNKFKYEPKYGLFMLGG